MPIIKNPTTINKSGGGEDKLAYRISNLGNYTYENNEITELKGSAFYDDKNLIEIKCDNVTRFSGASIFRRCSSLTTANFPNLVNSNTEAFTECTSLISINFPVLQATNYDGFSRCSSLTSANFPSVTSISDQSFYYCSALVTADFPLATRIGNSTFASCTKLASTSFPLVTAISSYAFYGCSSLTSISFPSATSIASSAFDGCTSLTSITLGNTSQVCTLSATNAIPASSSHHVNIYVPINLIASYRTATNWSTLYNNGYISILPIDGQLISVSNTNGTYTGDIAIANNGTATVTLSANSGYELPSAITVTGASYTYNQSTGVVSLSNPTAEVNISCVCQQATPSGYSVSVSSFGSSPYNLGHAYYSLDDGATWVEITGAGTLTTSATQIKFKAYDDSAGAQESVEIISSTLGLNIESSPVNSGDAISSNYTLSSNVADIQIIFHDND